MVGNTTRENPPAGSPTPTSSGGSAPLGKMGGGAAQGETKDLALKRRLRLAFLSAELTETIRKATAEANKKLAEELAAKVEEAQAKFDAEVKKLDEEEAKEAEAASNGKAKE